MLQSAAVFAPSLARSAPVLLLSRPVPLWCSELDAANVGVSMLQVLGTAATSASMGCYQQCLALLPDKVNDAAIGGLHFWGFLWGIAIFLFLFCIMRRFFLLQSFRRFCTVCYVELHHN